MVVVEGVGPFRLRQPVLTPIEARTLLQDLLERFGSESFQRALLSIYYDCQPANRALVERRADLIRCVQLAVASRHGFQHSLAGVAKMRNLVRKYTRIDEIVA